MPKALRSFLYPALLMVASTPGFSEDKVPRLEIVDRAIDFHGGRLFESAQVSLTVTSRSGSFDVISRVDDGTFDYRVFREGAEGKEVYRHSNDLVEHTRDGQPVALDEAGAERVRNFVSARLYFCLLPYRLNDPNTWKEDLGIEDWGGRRLHKVRVTFSAGSSANAQDAYLYWFDPDTARLEQFAYSFQAGDGGLRFRTLANYRRVSGLLLADQENFAVNGGGFSVDQLTPDFVAERMEHLSTVRFTNVEVELLK